MGPDGARHESDRDDVDGTDKPHYGKRLAESDGHEESIFKRRDDGESQDQRQNNHNHDPDEFHYASVHKY